MKQESKLIERMWKNSSQPIKNFSLDSYPNTQHGRAKLDQDLKRFGINISELVYSKHAFDSRFSNKVSSNSPHYSMDTGSLQPTISPNSIAVPAQFLQNFLPGQVLVQTTKMSADEIIGLNIIGTWEDEELVQRQMEYTGQPVIYSDFESTPQSSWNQIFESRTIVRFLEGMQVGDLESLRSAKAFVDSASEKRNAAAVALNRLRDTIAWYGFNNGVNRTYGLLNEPSLLPYLTLPTGNWATATYDQIIRDLMYIATNARTQSGGHFEPSTMECIMPLPINVIGYLGVTTISGYSVMDWLARNFPKLQLISNVEFQLAFGGLNVGYLYPRSVVVDGSTDNGSVIDQNVPVTFRFNGSRRDTTYLEESYSMATAGVMVKRPLYVTRFAGI
jgi:hypothetical protein